MFKKRWVSYEGRRGDRRLRSRGRGWCWRRDGRRRWAGTFKLSGATDRARWKELEIETEMIYLVIKLIYTTSHFTKNVQGVTELFGCGYNFKHETYS